MSDVLDAAEATAETRTQRLKGATTELHEALDQRLMKADLFSSRATYGRFLEIQRRFHRDIAALYADAGLQALVPDLAARGKLAEIDQDLADLNVALPADDLRAVDPADRAAALGWLYVSEGSSLGAAFLFKAAQHLGLSDGFGARHLAAHPEGRGLNWKRFVAALDAVDLSHDEEARAEKAAVAAFARVRAIAEDVLGRA